MVVADTSPLHYLVLVQVTEILPSLFHQVLFQKKYTGSCCRRKLRRPCAPGSLIRPPG